MKPEERETIIVLNRADMAEGLFTFGTSEASEFRRLCRRIGGQDKLLGLRTRQQGCKIAWWEAQVPIRFLSRTTWAIGARKPRSLTDKQREAMRRRARLLSEVKNNDN